MRLVKIDGQLYTEHVRRVKVKAIHSELQKQATAQYNRERIASGDPPYSIGNDWLQRLSKEFPHLSQSD